MCWDFQDRVLFIQLISKPEHEEQTAFCDVVDGSPGARGPSPESDSSTGRPLQGGLPVPATTILGCPHFPSDLASFCNASNALRRQWLFCRTVFLFTNLVTCL